MDSYGSDNSAQREAQQREAEGYARVAQKGWQSAYDDLKVSYDNLNATLGKQAALLAQMVAALETVKPSVMRYAPEASCREFEAALTAYRTLSPDPQWQRVPDGCVVVHMMDIRNMAFLAQRDEKATGIGKTIICTDDAEKLRAILDKILNRARGEG